MKILRAHYVSMVWANATTPSPANGLAPCEYGWTLNDNSQLRPLWFDGPEVPEILFETSTSNENANSVEVCSDSGESESEWSDDSDGG